MTTGSHQADRVCRVLPWILGVVSLGPLIVFYRDFAALFWFGDDWDLINQISHQGFWTWIWHVFAENFVPVFKLGWVGLLFIGHGSYFTLLAALWISHVACVVLFAKLLQRAGCSRWVVVAAAGVFGLSSINVETLGWATQWSSVLATLFMLAAVNWYLAGQAVAAPWSWRTHGVLVALVAASACSFSRGILTGATLAAITLMPGWQSSVPRRKRLALATVCLAPALGAAAIILLCSHGNQRHLTDGHYLEMLRYATWYFALNPLHRLLDFDSLGWRTVVLLGSLKLAAIIHGLRRSSGPLRATLVFLVLVELGNSLLLGLGRYHTGTATVISSRYQYTALLGTLPFIALWLKTGLQHLPLRRGIRPAAATALMLLAGWLAVRDWPKIMPAWSANRGRNTRHILFVETHPPAEGAIPGIPFMSTARAKELVVLYHLH